ncbi:MAG: hypothetical protein CL583_03755 [Alteromonadaceae bacterium]|nr:hypothetical protein [Alteromonadaceae bacterium]
MDAVPVSPMLREPLINAWIASGFQSYLHSRRDLAERVVAFQEVATQSVGSFESAEGRALKAASTALRLLARATAIPGGPRPALQLQPSKRAEATQALIRGSLVRLITPSAFDESSSRL